MHDDGAVHILTSSIFDNTGTIYGTLLFLENFQSKTNTHKQIRSFFITNTFNGNVDDNFLFFVIKHSNLG